MKEEEFVVEASSIVTMKECIALSKIYRTSPKNIRRIFQYNVITIAQAAQLLSTTPSALYVMCKPQMKAGKVYEAKFDTFRAFSTLNKESELDLTKGTQFVKVNEKFMEYLRSRIDKTLSHHKSKPRFMKRGG